MTEKKKSAPRGTKPRGRAASVAQVDLYRLLFNAARPLTFKEISEGLNSAYRNDAYRAYAESGLPEVRYIEEIKGDWSAELKTAAWEWWVERQLQHARINKRINITRADGQQVEHVGQWAHIPRDEKAWSANPGKPPMVRETITTTVTNLVPWNPKIGQAGVRHTKKRRYLNTNDEVMALLDGIRDKKLAARLRQHMADGAEALDDSSQPDPGVR